jgi:Predicted transcriptional regulator
MAILNEHIKEMRLKRGFTLIQVAELLGVKEATIQRYESGEIKNIKHEYIAKLAEIFNCSPAYLMGWEDSILISGPQEPFYDVELLIARNGKQFTNEQKMELIRMLSELK